MKKRILGAFFALLCCALALVGGLNALADDSQEGLATFEICEGRVTNLANSGSNCDLYSASVLPALAETNDTFAVSDENLKTEPEEYIDSEVNEECVGVLSEGVTVSSRLLELFFGKGNQKKTTVALGGNVFGVKLKQSFVSVADAKGLPALSRGDEIVSVDGRPVYTAEDCRRAVAECEGESITIKARRKGKDIAIEVRPRLEDGEYRLGLTLRDSAMGIGTMTFFDPETGLFGGLGHGICDGDTGEVVDMRSGEITGALLGGIHKGEAGKPGELTGILTDDTQGSLRLNCDCGVFGVLSEIPTDYTTVEIGSRDLVHNGEATIISTLKNGKTAQYKIEIYDIDKSSDGSKSFRIRVTDEVLKALTGGVVRGMSGSPIIQDGKLVGAVTHVMVADPTEGYGIFIENMLSAANEGALPKVA